MSASFILLSHLISSPVDPSTGLLLIQRQSPRVRCAQHVQCSWSISRLFLSLSYLDLRKVKLWAFPPAGAHSLPSPLSQVYNSSYLRHRHGAQALDRGYHTLHLVFPAAHSHLIVISVSSQTENSSVWHYTISCSLSWKNIYLSGPRDLYLCSLYVNSRSTAYHSFYYLKLQSDPEFSSG